MSIHPFAIAASWGYQSFTCEGPWDGHEPVLSGAKGKRSMPGIASALKIEA